VPKKEQTVKEGSTSQSYLPTPAISLPKGGGAIRGIGEKFAANPVTGTGSLSVPVYTSPGRSGFSPQLSLSYDSGAGNGPFGFGWGLSLPSITRKTEKGLPKYEDAEESDIFILSGAEDLVPVLVEVGGNWARETVSPRTVDGKIYRIQRYRPRVEGLFARIERWTNQADHKDTFWRSISKDNITTWYGKTEESRIADPADPSRIFSWLICESYDDKGNLIVYGYKEENSDVVNLSQAHERNRSPVTRKANRYLKSIRYGNHVPYFPKLLANQPWPVPPGADASDGSSNWFFEVVFDYGEHDPDRPTPNESRKWLCRHDPFSSYRSGFEMRTYRLCQRILMFHHFPNEPNVGKDCLIRSTDFVYRSQRDNPEDLRKGHPIASFVASVTQSGYRKRSDGSYIKKSLPPLEFTYSAAEINEEIKEIDAESLENLPRGLDGTRYQLVDLDGEGLSGILTEQGDAWLYKPNLGGGKFGPLEMVTHKPSLAAVSGGKQYLIDLAGDGQLDLVILSESIPGFYERTHDKRWNRFVSFASPVNIPWNDPNLRLVDLTGDGHADVLVTENEVFSWYPSLAEAGFEKSAKVTQPQDEERGPKLVFSDSTQSIYLADISGDGLTDLVRIRNGEVCYWPNLGYGRFSSKVTMDNAPRFDHPDQFDQQRIRLADIDGSGVTDIIYLGHDGVHLYFNESGNSWSDAQKLTQFPTVNNLSSVMVADLLGNGTACLVWSSPLPSDRGKPMQYIDLMGGQKPHLLIKVRNNLGAETIVSYVSSTKFYLLDKEAEKPWITRLPFPVHVVERVETYDWISHNYFVTRYAYHHGYYDGIEREFRGFGLVEQLDTEEFAALSTVGAFPIGNNIDETSIVPPVLTKTWFHTGAYVDGSHISRQFEEEYYREQGLSNQQQLALLLPDTILPLNLNPQEERESCRSLKGSILRQEIFALDGSPQSEHPYSVSERNYTIKLLQPLKDNHHAVFFTHPRETIDYHYERNPADPRASHALTLEVDDFGNVLKSVAIGYGRRQSDPALSVQEQAKQTQVLITYTENGFTNGIDTENFYRTPLPCETRTYELTGLNSPGTSRRFLFEEILNAGATATLIAYEQNPVAGILQKRLIEYVRTLYRRDDLSGSLPLGQVESLALPFESYKLAFTSGLIARVYGGRVTDAILINEGHYVHLEGDTNWWIPSGRVFYSTNPDDVPESELAFAREHFFLPHRFLDPFGKITAVTYDQYILLLQETRDASQNRVTVGERNVAGDLTLNGNDYRVLQPRLVMDANRNRSDVAFDALGMVVGTTMRGNPEENLGDSLDGFELDLPEATISAYFQNPLAEPHSLLKRASTRLIYDLYAYYRTRDTSQPQPAVVSTLARETHDSDLAANQQTKIQHSFSYSDGFGREIQKKIQAEPGPVVKDGPDVSPRWVGSGWTIFNNKGKPVRQYEPFFSTIHQFEFAKIVGVSSTLFYDPVERVVATLHPNHTYEKVVFDHWHQETWDVNDTVLQADPKNDSNVGDFFRRLPDSEYLQSWHSERKGGALGPAEQSAANKAAVHANTPTLAFFDTLGRTFLTIAHNRFQRNGNVLEEKLRTLIVLDIEGNQREVIDAKERVVMRYEYDMLSNRIRQESMEAGTRWVLNDVAGKPIYNWDSRGHVIRTTYDTLQRPSEVFLRKNNGPEKLIQQTVYGESQMNLEASNLRGKVYQVFDFAGLATSESYDFKGNLLRASRRILIDYKVTPDWSANPAIEQEVFTSSTIYDALNRPVTLTTPDNSVIQPIYNEANLLERIEVKLRGSPDTTNFVNDIDYNAKGQRELIEYGNGVQTKYEYDKLTFRLIHLQTFRGVESLQDLFYTYDPAGNITHIKDKAQQTIYFNNAVVEPDSEYTYDAIYRLIQARGREHIGQASQPETTWNDEFRVNLAHPQNGQAMRDYTEQYEYDQVGNILRLIHQANNGNWTRIFTHNEPSLIEPSKKNNRLSSNTIGQNTENYGHDAHGNMTGMPHLSQMAWDFKDQLQMVDLGGGGKAYYVYDAGGQRVRKVWEKSPGLIEERIYLGGFEIFRRKDGSGDVTLERETLHIMDDTKRIAMVETRTQGDDSSPAQLIRFQFGNHLGSASLELDGAGAIISYEEYYPYGSSSYQAVRSDIEVPLKRYRYTGMERDEESGLEYHSARYYLPWMGRWVGCDPAGLLDGANVYSYVKGNPIRLRDPSGRNIFEDLAQFIRNQAGFEQGARTPPTFQSSSASPFGTAAHGTATSVVQEMQQIGFVNACRVVSEPVIVNGVIVSAGSGPAGAPRGALAPDLLFTNQGTQGSVVGQQASAVAQELGDLKYGGGQAAAKYSQVGVPVRTVSGVTSSAATDSSLLQMAAPSAAPATPAPAGVSLSPPPTAFSDPSSTPRRSGTASTGTPSGRRGGGGGASRIRGGLGTLGMIGLGILTSMITTPIATGILYPEEPGEELYPSHVIAKREQARDSAAAALGVFPVVNIPLAILARGYSEMWMSVLKTGFEYTPEQIREHTEQGESLSEIREADKDLQLFLEGNW